MMKTIYTNGQILTLENSLITDSLAEENGIIIGTGSFEQLTKNLTSEKYQVIDLKGKTMMPSFIDAHSHLSSYASTFLQASLADAKNFQDILNSLNDFRISQQLGDGDWLIANSYDHNRLTEKQHPTKQMLDEAFPTLNIVLQHQSGHFGVMNSKAIKALGFEGKDSNGYLEENTWINAVKSLPLSSPTQLLKAYQMAFEHYASYGITTVQEGLMVKPMVQMYQMLLSQKALSLDVVGYPEINDADTFYKTFKQADNQYYLNFKLGGYKIILDGSPQGRTAWMRTPYIGSSDEYGVSSMTDEQVQQALAKAVRNGKQLLSHCNGDRAAQQLLQAAKSIGDVKAVRRIKPVIIHAQLLALDQLDEVKEYGFIPSFFVAHVYHWGDTHIKNFGLKRAEQISPANSAGKKGILYTFHQDTPVIQPDMLETIWCAVNRETKSGVVLGSEERISVEEALKAVTINAAIQYGEEKTKGTLTAGKLADFIILDQNPLTVPTEKLRSIKVLETYKNGFCIYHNEKI